jgi:hypothetical protein
MSRAQVQTSGSLSTNGQVHRIVVNSSPPPPSDDTPSLSHLTPVTPITRATQTHTKVTNASRSKMEVDVPKCRIFVDFLFIILLGLVLILFQLFASPVRNGYFCDDDTIRCVRVCVPCMNHVHTDIRIRTTRSLEV